MWEAHKRKLAERQKMEAEILEGIGSAVMLLSIGILLILAH